jgi:hypothetical protein
VTDDPDSDADPRAALAEARTDALVAGAAALVTVALAVADRPPLRAMAPLVAYVAYRAGGHRLTDAVLPWAGLAAVVGLVAAVV